MPSAKKKLGQFYTTNYDYILNGMVIPEEVNTIVEPFAGMGDLLKFTPRSNKYILELYDIDPKTPDITKRDSLKSPPCYDNKFILTNPPYLARNKTPDKELYDLYKQNDLYKCFIRTLINSNPSGGILILPLNFICSIRNLDITLRREFLIKFQITKINIFEENVFEDTSYSVCSLIFNLRQNENFNISIDIFPSNKKINITLDKHNNFTIGYELYKLPILDTLVIQRATKTTNKNLFTTNILLCCIDSNSKNKLGFKIIDTSEKDKYIDNTKNLSNRSHALIVLNKHPDIDKQKTLVNKLNEFIENNRAKYYSLFLTNYRESSDIARKRISFDLAFRILNHVFTQLQPIEP